MAGERILLDTNAVQYWLEGDKRFAPALTGLLRPLKRTGATLYISAVTVQELLVFAMIQGDLDRTYRLVQAVGTVLTFDERAALAAAKLGGVKPPPRGATTPEKDIWHRDLAVMGTATAHEMSLLVTANEKDFRPYEARMSCELHILRPIERRS